MGDLFTDYLAYRDPLAGFFAASPAQLFEATPPVAAWQPALVEEVRKYQAALGGTAVIGGDELVIVTGQQPGLLTGPLYTIYKAITALQLARTYTEKTGLKCLPLFWTASDDHDFEEVRQVHLLSKHDEPFLLRYTPAADVDGLPMHRVPAEPALHDLIDTAADAARGGEFRSDVAAFLHESLDAAESYGDWFARILARLFRDTPLALFAPHLSAARELAAPIFERAIRHPREATELVNAEGGKLSRLGYAQQVEKGSNECAFFIEVEGRRRNVRYQNGTFLVQHERIEFDEAGLLELLRKQPDRFSANVALRPLVQQHLFPTLAYVAGPGEIAYWGQLKPLFARYNLPMPIVYPRARALVSSEKLERWRVAYGFTLDDLSGPRDTLLDAALRDTRSDPAQAALEQHRPRINDAINDAARHAAAKSDIAGPMFDAMERHAERQLDRIARALAHRNAEKTAAATARIDHLQNVYAPWRKPQERVYTVFSFLFDYGWDLIPRLSRELDVSTFEMNEVVL